jgi:starch synthase
VIDANEMALANGVATGVQFAPVSLPAATDAFARAKSLWLDRDGWRRMQLNGMAADVGWTRPARQYASLYRSILQEA